MLIAVAYAHPRFMAHCAHRGHAISVFDSDRPAARSHETAGAETHLAGDHAAGVLMGDRTPGSQDRTDWEPGDPAGPFRSSPACEVGANPTERRPYGLRQA